MTRLLTGIIGDQVFGLWVFVGNPLLQYVGSRLKKIDYLDSDLSDGDILGRTVPPLSLPHRGSAPRRYRRRSGFQV